MKRPVSDILIINTLCALIGPLLAFDIPWFIESYRVLGALFRDLHTRGFF